MTTMPVNPHPCGENRCGKVAAPKNVRPIPAQRGESVLKPNVVMYPRSIPACVGKIPMVAGTDSHNAVNPHPRGENTLWSGTDSPLVGFIPARVGKTRCCCATRSLGAPYPRLAWGKHNLRITCRQRRRIIPTRVGKSMPTLSQLWQSKDPSPLSVGKNY